MRRTAVGCGLLAVVCTVGCKGPEIQVTILGDLKIDIPEHIKTVAVVANPSPDDLPGPPAAGGNVVDLRQQASGMLADYLGGLLNKQSKGRFTMVDRSNISKVLQEQKFQASGVVDPGTAVQAGKVIGAQAMIFGTVMATATSWKELTTKITGVGAYGVPQTTSVMADRLSVAVQGNLRMIDVTTSRVLLQEIPVQAVWSSDKGFLGDQVGMSKVKDPMTVLPALVRKCAMNYMAGLYDVREYTLPLYKTSGDKKAREVIAKGINFYPSALDQYRVFTRMRPGDHAAWYNVGVLSLALGDYDQARPALQQAAALKPDSADYNFAAGLLFTAEEFKSKRTGPK